MVDFDLMSISYSLSGEMMSPIPENSTGVGSSACTSASGSGFVSGLNECKGKCLASSDCNIINFCIEGCSLGANYCDLKSCSGDSYMIVNTYGTYEIYSKMNGMLDISSKF